MQMAIALLGGWFLGEFGKMDEYRKGLGGNA
jgi:hypothetical protein